MTGKGQAYEKSNPEPQKPLEISLQANSGIVWN